MILGNVSDLGTALDKALTTIEPIDTVQLGTAAPVINLDNILKRTNSRRSTKQPADYKRFHHSGTR